MHQFPHKYLKAQDANGINMMFDLNKQDHVAVPIVGSVSGDYKFSSKSPKKGEALFAFYPGNTPGIKGILFLTSGSVNFSLKNGSCSGSFAGSGTEAGHENGDKYEVKGSFNNIAIRKSPM